MAEKTITNEIFYTERFQQFSQISIVQDSESVPTDHYYAGIAIKRQDRYLAKAVLYSNPAIEYNAKHVGLIGAYQALEDQEATQHLFLVIEKLAKRQGLDYLIGPMNGSTWENYRFHDNPEKPLFFMEMRYPVYYVEQWKQNGFQPMAHYYSAITTVVRRQNEKLVAVKNRLLQDGVTFRCIASDRYEEELKKLYPFLHESFKDNFLYSSISEASFLKKYLPLQQVLNPEFILIAEHQGQIVGVLFGVDDLLDKSNKTLIIKTLARNPQRLYRGLGLVLVEEFYQKAIHAGYQQLIYAFMIDEGDATPLSDQYDGHLLKTYTLYGKAL